MLRIQQSSLYSLTHSARHRDQREDGWECEGITEGRGVGMKLERIRLKNFKTFQSVEMSNIPAFVLLLVRMVRAKHHFSMFLEGLS